MSASSARAPGVRGEDLEQVRRRPGREIGDQRRRRRARGHRLVERLARQHADLAERLAGPPREQPPVDLAPERGPSLRLVAVHVVHERTGVEAVLVADAQTLAQQRAGARRGGQRVEAPGARRGGGKVSLKLGK